MSQFQMSVHIPVKPHVKQYLEKNLFFKQKDFTLTSSSCIGSYLITLMEPKRRPSLPLRYKPENIITVNLTDNYNYIARPYISPTNAHKFNLFVERKMREDMFVFISSLTDYAGKEINEAIKEYQLKYSFRDDDVALETMKKAYYRYRKSVESRKNTSSKKTCIKTVPS